MSNLTGMGTHKRATTRGLEAVAAEINDYHQLAARHATAAITAARRAGELLNEAKPRIGHGGWLNWLKENCNVSARQAQRYMKIAANWDTIKNDAATHLTIDEAILEVVKMESIQAVQGVLDALPAGKMLLANGENGLAIIFRKPESVFWHFYQYSGCEELGGEMQFTRRAVRPRGIALMLLNQGANIADFSVVEDAGDNEVRHNPAELLKPVSDCFYSSIQIATPT